MATCAVMLGVAAVSIALGHGFLALFSLLVAGVTVAIQLALAALVIVVALMGMTVGIVGAVRMRRSRHA